MARKKRKMRKEGTRFKTQSGYIIRVKKVGPFVFQELRNLYNVDRSPFERSIDVPETGATLKFPYQPPSEEPDRETDVEEWTLYHEYRNWLESFEADTATYTKSRNELLLNLAITSIKHPDISVSHEIEEGSWIEYLEGSGISVDDTNRRYLFLKTMVLGDEQDYLDVIQLAIAEEVTLGDIMRAFEYFQNVMARSSFKPDLPELTFGEGGIISEPVGSISVD